jgi:hypothetical protein
VVEVPELDRGRILRHVVHAVGGPGHGVNRKAEYPAAVTFLVW